MVPLSVRVTPAKGIGMRALVLLGLILALVGCSSTPPAESPTEKDTPSSSEKEPATPATTAVSSPETEPVTQDDPPEPAPTAEPATPAESGRSFKNKIEAKCLEKYPKGKWRRKGCTALLVGAVRTTCKYADEGKADQLCDEHPKLCTPEVQEIIKEAFKDGNAFCNAFNENKED